MSEDLALAGSPTGHDRDWARRHLAIALDVDDLATALVLMRALHPYFAVAKVGLELYAAAGSRAIEALADEGMEVFLDLKLHDIPTTVGRTARVLGALGVSYLTVHTVGGEAMCRAAVEGLATGAGLARRAAPVVVGVTVLTSDKQADPGELERRAEIAVSSGCKALVCAAPDLRVVRAVAHGLLTVVPGTRPPGAALDDQARSATPAEAIAMGADLLVIGRPVTRAPDPALAAEAIVASLLGAGLYDTH